MPNLLHPSAHVLTVAATGASGAMFTRALLLSAERDERVKTVNFIASDNALRVFAAPTIIDALLTEESAALAQMRALIGKPVSLQTVMIRVAARCGKTADLPSTKY